MSFTVEKLQDIEEHLKNHPTLTEGGVPGPVDGSIFVALGSTYSPIQSSQKRLLTPTSTFGISSSPPSALSLSKTGLVNTSLLKLQQSLLPNLPMTMMWIYSETTNQLPKSRRKSLQQQRLNLKTPKSQSQLPSLLLSLKSKFTTKK